MKRVAAVVLLGLFVGGVARAEESALPALWLAEPELVVAKHNVERAELERDAGIALTVAGSLFTVFGSLGVCLGDSSCHGVYGNSSWSSELASIIVVGVGQTMLVPGITLWAHGGQRAKRAQQKVLSMTAGGVRLTF